ncbi:MAG: nitrous oxide reductase family maturation protein NosD [Paracoccaceae bacterium]
MIRAAALVLSLLLPGMALAARIDVPAGGSVLKDAIAGAAPGDVLILGPGLHDGPVVLDRAITLDGRGAAEITGHGQGSVITVTGPDTVVRGLIITGSGKAHKSIDSGVKLTKTARGALIEDNILRDNLYGIDIHGARDTIARGNDITGGQDRRMNDRGNGIYVWNAPGAEVSDNRIRFGRDGIFVNTSKDNVFRNNLLRDLRFAVHYMYTHDSEISGNVSIGNHLGFALMFSERITVTGNLSLRDRGHGIMLNYANSSDIVGNLVRGGAEKCTFVYNAHKNLIAQNRFEGCDIGIHFTAGSERNGITGNAFVGNRNQVKYVGTRDVEWSLDGIGNYWSDNPGFDLNGDGIGDNSYRPNDLMDHILWSQPAAALLTGSPAVQLIRWSQSSFPATLPGGVVDSFPQTRAIEIAVPDDIAALEASTNPDWMKDSFDDTGFDPLASH